MSTAGVALAILLHISRCTPLSTEMPRQLQAVFDFRQISLVFVGTRTKRGEVLQAKGLCVTEVAATDEASRPPYT